MTAFDRAIAFTLGWEKEHSPDPVDPGGDTWYGITRRYHPTMEPWPPTRAQAVAQYEREYWRAPGFSGLPDAVAVACFDTAVNCGTRRTISMLQQALRVFDDSLLGPKTLAEASVADQAWLVKEIIARRLRYYASLDATEDRYELGWARRSVDLLVLCIGLVPRTSRVTS